MKISTKVNLDDDSDNAKDFSTSNGEEENQEHFYRIQDKLPFILSFLNAFQIMVCQLLSVVWLPLYLSSTYCILPADPARVQLVSLALLTSGVVSFLQSTIGIRLPTVAAPSVVYASSILHLLGSTDDYRCAHMGDLYAMGPELRTVEWQNRLRELQGVMLFFGGLQTLLGISGLQTRLCSALSPETLATMVILSGMTFFQEPLNQIRLNWSLSCFSVPVVVMMCFLGRQGNIVLLPTLPVQRRFKFHAFYVIKMFPVLWTCAISCMFWKLLTRGTLDLDGKVSEFQEALDNADKFYFPIPFEWGPPTLRWKSVIQILPAFFIQSVASHASFHGNAKCCEAGTPPLSSVRRGLSVEGVGLALGALWGQGVATTPHSVGLTLFTGVASHSSTQLAAALMICASFFPSLLYMIAYIPKEVLSVVHLCLLCGLVCVGISMLLSSRTSAQNHIVTGASLFLGLVIPQLLAKNKIDADTGDSVVNSVINQCVMSPIVVGLAASLLLNRLLPGKKKETMSGLEETLKTEESHIYELPNWQELFCKLIDKVMFFYHN